MAIHKKLLEFQKLGITLVKDGENPHFRSSYVTLNEVLAKVKGPLNELGVVVVQKPGFDSVKRHDGIKEDTEYGLIAELIDTEDGTQVSCFVPFIGATDMQKLGGAITYARRYSLIALLGLEDADDDGSTAVGAKAASGLAQRPTGPVQMDSAPDFNSNDFKL
jgi:hypothetical protein